jgi:carbonic anhydrase
LNVHESVNTIIEKSKILAGMIANCEISIVGGIHDIKTGEVTFFE